MKTTPVALSDQEVAALRQKHYNAVVSDLRRVHDELLILRVRPDQPIMPYRAGQYTVLGLGYWEPRVEGSQPEDLKPGEETKVAKRAYSISSPILNDGGELLSPAEADFLEFYVTLIRKTEFKPPALTPRLFLLGGGDRLFVGPKITGHYTLEGVAEDDDVYFIATGTGEAPHNAMLRELLRGGHRGRLASLVCVRYRQDLAYLETHQKLVRRYPHYAYTALTTREPENLDRSHPNYVGKQYNQEWIRSGRWEEQLGRTLDPAYGHVYLCGNPQMIGIPETDKQGVRVYPEPTGVIEILEQRGFRADEPGRPGNIHFEKYW
jgi:ferredoxin--NADP+ reductase